MKLIAALAFFIFGSIQVQAQMSPVTWSFSARKTSDKMYEIEMKATIQDNWHLYSQKQPDDAIVNPTEFSFNPNPLFTFEGKIHETGKMEKFTDKTLGISAHQYSGAVTFIQKIKMKSKARTNITGSVEYQTCDDKKCLPPKKVPFSIAIR